MTRDEIKACVREALEEVLPSAIDRALAEFFSIGELKKVVKDDKTLEQNKKYLGRCMQYLPDPPLLITIDRLREQTGMGMANVTSAIRYGLSIGVVTRIEGKSGGLRRSLPGSQ